MNIHVRPAQDDDTPAMRTLFLRVRMETPAWRPSEPPRLEDFDAQVEGERLWVAQAEHQLAGFISLWEADSFIHHLFVDQRWSRRGAGRMLLRALPGWPVTRFQLKCLRLNEPALAFYRACGFSEIGSGESMGHAYALLESGGAG